MTWISAAISAYLILAVANLLDKFLVDNVLTSSKAYALVACVMGALVVLIAPWFLVWPGTGLLLFDLLSGAIFAVALWFLYEALRCGEAARILVFIGGITPVFSLIFSILFFHEHYSPNQWLGMASLLVGVLIIAFLPASRSFLARVMRKLRIQPVAKTGGLWIALFSALAYSLYFITTKYAYGGQPFASVFIWTRLGSVIFVLLFLIRKKDRQEIISAWRRPNKNKNKALVFFNQLLGAGGFILQNYAVFLGSVALVNALQGVQYAFLLIISSVLALLAPRLLKETFSWRIVLQKTLAVAIIGWGLYLIVF
jgi:drug/metabolite transporter (DMT)-like permease